MPPSSTTMVPTLPAAGQSQETDWQVPDDRVPMVTPVQARAPAGLPA